MSTADPWSALADDTLLKGLLERIDERLPPERAQLVGAFVKVYLRRLPDEQFAQTPLEDVYAHVLSMFGFVTILFFSVTGITLNHPTWFGLDAERVDDVSGELDRDWLAGSDDRVDRLAIAEHLRSRHGLRGAVTEFRLDDVECFVSFKGPGYAADAFIDRATRAQRGSTSTLTTRPIASRRSDSRIAASTPNQPPSTVTVPNRPPARVASTSASHTFEAICPRFSAAPRSGTSCRETVARMSATNGLAK